MTKRFFAVALMTSLGCQADRATLNLGAQAPDASVLQPPPVNRPAPAAAVDGGVDRPAGSPDGAAASRDAASPPCTPQECGPEPPPPPSLDPVCPLACTREAQGRCAWGCASLIRGQECSGREPGCGPGLICMVPDDLLDRGSMCTDAPSIAPPEAVSFTEIKCPAGQTLGQAPGDGPFGLRPSVAEEVVGANGSFREACDANGNLIEYFCGRKQRCFGDMNPVCNWFSTDQVAFRVIDCNGKCSRAACDDRCPTRGQRVVYVSGEAGGQVILRNLDDGRRYSCQHTPNPKIPTASCNTVPAPGTEARVQNDRSGQFCVTGRFGGLWVKVDSMPADCGYECSVLD